MPKGVGRKVLGRKVLGVAAIAGAAFVGTIGPAAAASINVSPSATAPAGTVTVSGDVLVNGQPGCTVPGTVTLISGAFAGISEFAGTGAVDVPVDAAGIFNAPVTLEPAVGPGTYQITGRCGGGNFGVTATLTVTGMPRTGGGFGPLSDRQVALCALAVIAFGIAATTSSRRRTTAAARQRM
jgi:hypothetical protein